ncbi:MAG: asparagine synthase C-terminal domain-containing protein, partial [Dehalococcoidia bacterium]
DVPVGFFLSGGIDSSAVVGVAREVTAAEIETFTVVFAEREFDEAGPAAAIAERFGTRHNEIPLSGDDLLASLPAAFSAMDQPSMDGLNTYVVSRAVRERGIKVVLSGLGGDELFAGYPSFRRARTLAAVWALGKPLRGTLGALAAGAQSIRADKARLLLASRDPARGAYLASRALFAGRSLSALAGPFEESEDVRPPEGLSLLQQVSWYETNGYMRNTLLRDSDVFSMAFGLELRVPFVDRRMVSTAAAVDDRLKLRSGVSKPVLVDAVHDLLPPEVWDRPKQGFTLPFERWLCGPLRAEMEAALTRKRLHRVGVDADAARTVWAEFLRGNVGWSRPWALYTLVRWAEENDLSVEVERLSEGRVPQSAA